MPRIAATKRSLRCDIKGKISGVVNDVWTRGERTSIGEVAAHENIKSFSTAHPGDSRDLPSSKSGLRYAVRRTAEMFPSAVRQFVDITHGQLMPEIRGGWPPFRGNVMGVLDVTLVYVTVRSSQRFRVGVGSQNIEAALETMLDGGLQRVVEHAQPRDIQREHSIQAGQSTEIGPPLVKS